MIPQTFNQYTSFEFLNDQNLFTESKLADRFSTYVLFVRVVISQNELKLLGSVEK